MTDKKQKKSKQTEQLSTCHNQFSCYECGGTVRAAECCWQEVDEERIFCQHCREERDSCGCSD